MAKKKEAPTNPFVPVEEQPYQIPDNWCWTRMQNIALWGSGGTPSRKNLLYYKGTIPWIKTGELNDNYIFETEEHISDDAVAHSNAKLFPVNTIAIAMYGATIGKVGILGIEAATNQACACGIVSSAVYFKYLFYYARSEKDNFVKMGKGGAQPNISQEIIKVHEIPIPPFPEQQRIVSRIESLFSKLDEAKEKVQAVVDGFELRKSAILHKAFTGELTERWRNKNNVAFADWKQVKFGDLGVLERGRSKHRPRNDPQLFGGKYPFIQTGDVARSGMYVVEHSQSLSEIGMEQSRIFPKGTLCITIAANIGDVAILTYDCCFPDSVVGFTPNNLTSSKFIYYMMSTIQRELEANAPATAQKNINLKSLNDLKINLPSLSEQNEIITMLEMFFAQEQQAREAAEAVLDQIDTMKKAILARAFRGELGTNDPAEEWAGEMVKKLLNEEI